MTALLAKAAAMALVQHPVVNASCKDGESCTDNSNINIAVAKATNGGKELEKRWVVKNFHCLLYAYNI